MIDKIVSFLQALIINVLLIVILIVSMEWVTREIPPNLSAMEATTVDERVFQAAVKQVEKEAKRRKATELATQQAFEEQQTSLETEKMRLAQLEIEEIDRKQREAEEQRRKLEEQRRKAEEQRLAQIAFERAERLRKRKETEETRQRVEEERKKKEAQAESERQRKEAAKQQAHEKIVEEKQRQATVEREKKKNAEAEKQAELNRNRREEAEKSRRQADQERQREGQEIAKKQAEERRQAELARGRQKQDEQKAKQACPNGVSAPIKAKIMGYWVQPPGSGHLSCSVRGYLLPGGKVGKIYISNSSGNLTFDSSALRAVYDASPFLVPTSAFQACKDINITFIPRP